MYINICAPFESVSKDYSHFDLSRVIGANSSNHTEFKAMAWNVCEKQIGDFFFTCYSIKLQLLEQSFYTLVTKEYNFEMVLCQTKLFQTHFILHIPSFISVKILLVVTCLMYIMFQKVTSCMFVIYNFKNKQTAYI